MSAPTYEYKTVALPQIVQGRRRRGVSEADFVAETMGELIHLEAVDGWEYMRADTLAAGARAGMFSKEPKITYYSVLVFRRMQEGVWPIEDVSPARAPYPAPAESAPAVAPRPPVTAARPPVERAPEPEPARPVINDPTSPLAQGMVLTTGGQFQAGKAATPFPPPKTAPRPPLGSAQD